MNITEQAKQFAVHESSHVDDEVITRSVTGGYSRNRKSLVGKGDAWFFVKEVDIDLLPDDGKEELGWLKKEAELVHYLSDKGFSVAPDWCKLSDDGTVLLLPAYRSEEGWIWGYPDDSNQQYVYVDAVVRAAKELEAASFPPEDVKKYTLQPFFRDELAFDNGFELLIHNDAFRTQVLDKLASLTDSPHGQLLQNLQDCIADTSRLEALAHEAVQLAKQPNDAFGHCDVRSDNLSYNVRTGEVKLVDWNWASFTPAGFGPTEFLTDAARHGVDVSPWLHYVNPQLLAASVGFYARRCTKDPLTPGDTLREMQAEAAAIAYDLYKKTVH